VEREKKVREKELRAVKTEEIQRAAAHKSWVG
jgi:hypothetical protein